MSVSVRLNSVAVMALQSLQLSETDRHPRVTVLDP
jgi:hypothetical protein